jgi:hypothetical protein
LRGSGRSEGRQTHDRALVIDRVLLLVRVAVVAEDRDVGGGVLLVVHLAVGRPVLAGGWCRGVEGKGKGRWRGGGRGLRWGAREEGQPAIGPRRHLKGSQADEVGRTVVSWDCAISWVAFGSSGPSRCREENRAPCCPGRQGPAGRLDRARAHDSRTKPRRRQGDPFHRQSASDPPAGLPRLCDSCGQKQTTRGPSCTGLARAGDGRLRLSRETGPEDGARPAVVAGWPADMGRARIAPFGGPYHGSSQQQRSVRWPAARVNLTPRQAVEAAGGRRWSPARADV